MTKMEPELFAIVYAEDPEGLQADLENILRLLSQEGSPLFMYKAYMTALCSIV
jgi:hypothetical protein